MSSIPSHAGNYDSSDSVDPRQHMAAATVAPASAVGASTSAVGASTSRPAPALPGPASAAGAGLLALLAVPVLELLDRGRPASAGCTASALPRETGPPGPYLGGSRWSGSPGHVGASTQRTAGKLRLPSAALSPRAVGGLLPAYGRGRVASPTPHHPSGDVSRPTAYRHIAAAGRFRAAAAHGRLGNCRPGPVLGRWAGVVPSARRRRPPLRTRNFGGGALRQ